MVDFNKGDLVMIAKDSVYYSADDAGNPKDTEGIITEIGGGHMRYRVYWGSGRVNLYAKGDLALYESTSEELNPEVFDEKFNEVKSAMQNLIDIVTILKLENEDLMAEVKHLKGALK